MNFLNHLSSDEDEAELLLTSADETAGFGDASAPSTGAGTDSNPTYECQMYQKEKGPDDHPAPLATSLGLVSS